MSYIYIVEMFNVDPLGVSFPATQEYQFRCHQGVGLACRIVSDINTYSSL